jgi:PPP family 3-phenylpropionic acid transporter
VTAPQPALPVVSAPPLFAARMGAFFACYFGVNGVVVPFFPVWLAGRGLSEVEIANIIAIPLAVRVLLTPLGGVAADRTPNRRFAVRLFILPAVFVFVLAWPTSSYWPLLLITGLAFTIWSLGLPGAEALALTGARRFGIDYGRMRLWGSVAFITINLGTGALLVFMPRESIFWFITVALVLSSVGALLLPVTPRNLRALDDATRPARRPAWFVLTRPAFLLLVLGAGFISASHATYYGFGSIYFEGMGFSTFQIGLFWAASLACEITFFVWSTAVHEKLGPYRMIALGGLAAMVRWAALSFELDLFGYMAVSALHGLTFASVFLGTQHAVVRSVPEEYAASSQSIVLMVGGLLMAGLTALSGPLFEQLHGAAFLTMIVPAALGVVIIAVLYRLDPR